ncbi:probable profilin [Phialocephala subalpina]|uniref:Profilin n=1 Tax=Phialocephala subalpina TaxID=576137 RepID=A0A1L7XFV5_9HELO|nr:probable profilin [Phialocephala subalpina]
MSWQAYVDSSLVGSQQISKGAIYSAAGDSKWAATPGFELSAAEAKTIATELANPKTDSKVWSDGIHVAGVRYVVTKLEDRSLYGRQGKEGIVIVKTTQAILIGHYPENVQAGNAAVVVEKLADYLVGLGY